MKDKIKELYNKYKEIINYLIFGVLTTIVNFVVYFIFAKLFGIDELLSNIIAWVLSVLFAYTTNRKYVFENKADTKKGILREISSFFACRLFSGVLDNGLFAFLVKGLHINDMIVKLINQVIVTVLNYVFSKWIIFRKNKT